MLIDITAKAEKYSEKLTIAQVEKIFTRYNIDIDRKYIKYLQTNNFLPPLNNIRFYTYSHVIIIYIIKILSILVKEEVIKENINMIFPLTLKELVIFYETFFYAIDDIKKMQSLKNENKLYMLLYFVTVYKNQ